MPSAAPDAGPLLRARGLTVTYPRAPRPTLDRIALTVRRGERLAVMGASGSGKTTLIHALTGIVPDLVRAEVAGEVAWDDDGWATPSLAAARPRVALLAQATGVQLATLAVEDELAFALASRRLAADEIDRRIAAALASRPLAGLAPTTPTLTLSGGWRQRLAFAAAFAEPSACLVLDEPFAHLDGDATAATVEMIRDGVDDGRALVIVEHRFDLVRRLVDRVVLLDGDGRILADEAPDRLLADEGRLAAAGLSCRLAGRPRVRRAPAAALIAIDGGRVALGRRTLIEAIDLAVHAGEIVALGGPNGVGKSTLGLVLAGMRRLAAGRLVVAPGSRVLMVPQNPDLFFACGRLDDEATRLGHSWEEFHARAAELGVAVRPDSHPLHFSQGQKRRLALALALPGSAAPPRVLIVDEPQSGLDGRNLAALTEALITIAERGHAVLVIAHDREWTARFADRRLAIADLRLVEEEGPR